MLDQDEGHAVAGRQRVHQLPAGIEAARRGAYSDDREVPEIREESRAPPVGAGPHAAEPPWPDADGFLAFLNRSRTVTPQWEVERAHRDQKMASVRRKAFRSSHSQSLRRRKLSHNLNYPLIFPDAQEITN